MSKARPRLSAHGVYMPKPYQDWRKECVVLLKNAWDREPIDHPIAVEVDCFGTARGDVDNYLGAIFDCANKILWVDDRATIIQKAQVCFYKRPKAESLWKIRIFDLEADKL